MSPGHIGFERNRLHKTPFFFYRRRSNAKRKKHRLFFFLSTGHVLRRFLAITSLHKKLCYLDARQLHFERTRTVRFARHLKTSQSASKLVIASGSRCWGGGCCADTKRETIDEPLRLISVRDILCFVPAIFIVFSVCDVLTTAMSSTATLMRAVGSYS